MKKNASSEPVFFFYSLKSIQHKNKKNISQKIQTSRVEFLPYFILIVKRLFAETCSRTILPGK